MMWLRLLMRKQYKLCTLLTGIGAVLAFYMTWCLATISYQGVLYEALHFVSTLIMVLLYVGCVMIFEAYWGEARLERQLRILNAGIFGMFLLILLSDIRSGSLWLLLSDIVWLAATGHGWRVLKCRLGQGLETVWAWFRQNYMLIVLLAFAAVLGAGPTMLQFRWDGALYEQACRGMNIHSMSSMAAYAHLAQGYGVIFCLVNALISDTDMAMAATNIILYIAGIMAFWGIMRVLVPEKKRWTYLAITAVYACSPYLLGMVNYYSLDFATLCLFVCMLYFWVKREWVLQFAAALFACFTKEPAIISYGALCVGMVLSDILRQDKHKITDRIRSLFQRLYYYPMLLTGLLWVVTYLFLGGWNAGDGGTAVDAAYMADKLKVLYILNFSWIFTGILIGGSLRLLTQKAERKNVIWWILPLMVSTAGFTLFSLVFKTVNHARYAAQVPAVLYIAVGYVLLSAFREKAAAITAGLLACLMLASSYLTIDPVSRVCFPVLDTGSGQMITTGTPVPGDSMIYNKQMLGMEYALNKAVEDALRRDCMIIMPMHEETPNLFDGLMQEMEKQTYGYTAVTHWSKKRGRRTLYAGEDTIPFTIYEWSGDAEITQLPLEEKEKHCYIYSSLLGADRAPQILERYAGAEYWEYNDRGWTVSVLIF